MSNEQLQYDVSRLQTLLDTYCKQLDELEKEVNSYTTSSDKLKDDIYKVAKGISDITQKLSAYITIQTSEKITIKDDISSIQKKVDDLLAKSFATSQLFSDVISNKNAIEELRSILTRLKNEFDTYKQLTAMAVDNAIKIKDQQCNIHMNKLENHISDYGVWKKSIDEDIDKCRKCKYGFSLLYKTLGVLLLIITIIGGVVAIVKNTNDLMHTKIIHDTNNNK